MASRDPQTIDPPRTYDEALDRIVEALAIQTAREIFEAAQAKAAPLPDTPETGV